MDQATINDLKAEVYDAHKVINDQSAFIREILLITGYPIDNLNKTEFLKFLSDMKKPTS